MSEIVIISRIRLYIVTSKPLDLSGCERHIHLYNLTSRSLGRSLFRRRRWFPLHPGDSDVLDVSQGRFRRGGAANLGLGPHQGMHSVRVAAGEHPTAVHAYEYTLDAYLDAEGGGCLRVSWRGFGRV